MAAIKKSAAPELVFADDGTPSNLYEVVSYLVNYLRKTYFEKAQVISTGIPLERAVKEAGYIQQSRDLMALLKRAGVCIPTGSREGRGGPYVYVVVTHDIFKRCHSPGSLGVAWNEVQSHQSQAAELQRLRRDVQRLREQPAAAPVVDDPVVSSSTPLADQLDSMVGAALGVEQAAKLTEVLERLESELDTLTAENRLLAEGRDSDAALIRDLRQQLEVAQTAVEAANAANAAPEVAKLLTVVDRLGEKLGKPS